MREEQNSESCWCACNCVWVTRACALFTMRRRSAHQL